MTDDPAGEATLEALAWYCSWCGIKHYPGDICWTFDVDPDEDEPPLGAGSGIPGEER